MHRLTMQTIGLLLVVLISMRLVTTAVVASRQHHQGHHPAPQLSTTRLEEYGDTMDYQARRKGTFPKYTVDTASMDVMRSGDDHVRQNEQATSRKLKLQKEIKSASNMAAFNEMTSERAVGQSEISEYSVEQPTYDDRQPTTQLSKNSADHDTIPGVAGTDFPDYLDVPLTGFYCHSYKQAGYYADVETGCQVFHVCDVDGRQDSFLCPRGTIFNQPYLTCDWWFNVDCSGAADYYGISTDLHKMAASTSSRGEQLESPLAEDHRSPSRLPAFQSD